MELGYSRAMTDDVGRLVELRVSQLREEGAEDSVDLGPVLREYYAQHFSDGTIQTRFERGY